MLYLIEDLLGILIPTARMRIGRIKWVGNKAGPRDFQPSLLKRRMYMSPVAVTTTSRLIGFHIRK